MKPQISQMTQIEKQPPASSMLEFEWRSTPADPVFLKFVALGVRSQGKGLRVTPANAGKNL
jgi:hypothetical protein